MIICAHESFDGLSLVYTILLESAMSILGLAYERAIFQLLDLKIKKEFDFFHHRHFKPIGHDLAKFITKDLLVESKIMSST
jgi:hypothetical protein